MNRRFLISSTVHYPITVMPEQRARAYHRSRVANTFSEEIGAMLEGELSDPRIAPSYVTDVVLAPGGKSARIYVAVHGNEEEEESTLAGLMTARAYIRSAPDARDIEPDLSVPAILLECDGIPRTGLLGLEGRCLINVDHHASGREFGNLNWIDEDACAVAEMVYRIALAAEVRISPSM